jgi:DmsE family decaheme c-type cytochrome
MKPRASRSNYSIAGVGLVALGLLVIPAYYACVSADASAAPPARPSKPRSGQGASGVQSSATTGASIVGSGKCAECHPEIASFYRAGTHQRPFFGGLDGGGCESCHGPGSKHAESTSKDDIVNREGMKKLSAHQASDRCLSCHRSNVRHIQGWFMSQHARAEVSCWDCHGEVLHHLAKDGKPLPATSVLPNSKERIINLFMANPNEYCYRCHERQRLEFALPFRHPLERGKMACVDCHNPHGEEWRQQIVTQSVENESDALCFRCHAEYRGPFVWQHQAMEEGCTACHRPHGSPNRRLLRVSGNSLCLQCHFERQLPTLGRSDHQSRLSRFARCLDCHIRPHGSNVSEDLTQ